MAERHRQGAVDGIKYSSVQWLGLNIVYTCDMSNIRYVYIIKVTLFRVALFKVTSDPFIKVVSI